MTESHSQQARGRERHAEGVWRERERGRERDREGVREGEDDLLHLLTAVE